MNKSKKDILEFNVLDLSTAGLDYFPGLKVRVAAFQAKEEDARGYVHLVEILLIVDKSKIEGDEVSGYCFLVQDGLTYYYREHIDECLDVIQAIRAKYNFIAPWGKFS